MFEKITNFFKGLKQKEKVEGNMVSSKNTAKERLHLVLMQDRANVSADFLELMKQEIIEVIKKYIEVDEGAIDVRLTNKPNDDGTTGAPALYANIPIMNIKHEMGKDTEASVGATSGRPQEEKQEEANVGASIDSPENEEESKVEQEPTEETQTSENNEVEQEQQNVEESSARPQEMENQKEEATS